MKKVLFTATVDSHILQFHLSFLKKFKEKGYEVHVATKGNDEIPYCDVKHFIPFERSPLKINNIKAIFKLKKICDFEKFDIIHTHTPMGSVVTRLAAMKARNKYHTRLIYTAHGFHFFKGAPIKNWILFYPIEKFLSRFTDTLILINEEDFDIYPKAQVIGIEARSEFDSMYPMEVPVTSEEYASLTKDHSDYMVFLTDRINHIKMRDTVPYMWYQSGEVLDFTGTAQPNEIWTFQIGILALKDIEDLPN